MHATTVSALADVAEDVIRQAVYRARETPQRTITRTKSVNNYATVADEAVERFIVGELRRKTGLPVQGEESAWAEDAGTRWTVDPIDGTFNYRNRIPLGAVSIALLDRHEPVIGVVASLDGGEIFSASSGRGAALNGTPIAVTRQVLEESAVLVGDFTTTVNPTWSNADRAAVIAHLGETAGRIRMIGTAATDLAWVSAGRAAGSVIFDNNAWDVAAGIALVREAGGVVIQADGQPWTTSSAEVIAACNLDTALSIAAALPERARSRVSVRA